MELDVGLIKYDQILENIVLFDKEEIIFDIGTSEIIKKGSSNTTLKIKNLLYSRIALRITVPKDRFKVSPIYSYLDSQETYTYKFTYIYKEKSLDVNSKIYVYFEIIISPKIKQHEIINPLTLYENIIKNGIPVKGLEKKIPIKIMNSLIPDSISSPILLTEKNIYSRCFSKINTTEMKKDIKEDFNDTNVLCDLLKQNMTYLASNNKHLKDEVEIKLFNFFNKTSLFSKFIRFYRIDESALKQAVKYLEYLKVPKNYYLFIQGDQSRYFFGIISGRVSLRIRTKLNPSKDSNSQSSNKKIQLKTKKSYLAKSNPNMRNSFLNFVKFEPSSDMDYIESDYIKLGSGSCFGEWGLIYNHTRTTSALAIEDCEFFILSKDYFLNSFGKNIFKAENERKDFLIKCLPLLKDVHRAKIDEIYRKLSIEIVSNNQIIYRENWKADFLYLIINGECKLEKNLREKDFDDNALNAKRIVLLKLGVGDFCGIEHVSNCDHYMNTLTSSNDSTAIMRINLNLWPDFKAQVAKFLKPLHEQRTKFLKEMYQECLNKRLRINYNYKVGPITKNDIYIKREEKLRLEKLESIIEKVERKLSSSPSKVLNTVVTRSHVTSTNISTLNQNVSLNNPKMLDLKRVNTNKKKKKNIKETFFNRVKTSNDTENEKIVNESYIDQISFREENRSKDQKLNKVRKFRYSKSNIKSIKELELINKPEKKKSNSFNTLLFVQKLENKRIKLVSPKVENNLNEWQHTISLNKFHSGNFELPLYTFAKNE